MHGFVYNNRKAAGLNKCQPIGRVGSSDKMCTLHRELVFSNVCSVPFEARPWAFLKLGQRLL